jgi:hypothetical protein
MRHTVNPQQGRLFDPYEGLIPPLGMDRIRKGWQGIFRSALLALMPAKELGKHFDPIMGRPTKELYSVAGLLFIQEFKNWTNAEAVHAYLFYTDVQFALNLEPGIDEMCERTFERYRKLFVESEHRRPPATARLDPRLQQHGLVRTHPAHGRLHQAFLDAGQTPSPCRL